MWPQKCLPHIISNQTLCPSTFSIGSPCSLPHWGSSADCTCDIIWVLWVLWVLSAKSGHWNWATLIRRKGSSILPSDLSCWRKVQLPVCSLEGVDRQQVGGLRISELWRTVDTPAGAAGQHTEGRVSGNTQRNPEEKWENRNAGSSEWIHFISVM